MQSPDRRFRLRWSRSLSADAAAAPAAAAAAAAPAPTVPVIFEEPARERDEGGSDGVAHYEEDEYGDLMEYGNSGCGTGSS